MEAVVFVLERHRLIMETDFLEVFFIHLVVGVLIVELVEGRGHVVPLHVIMVETLARNVPLVLKGGRLRRELVLTSERLAAQDSPELVAESVFIQRLLLVGGFEGVGLAHGLRVVEAPVLLLFDVLVFFEVAGNQFGSHN